MSKKCILIVDDAKDILFLLTHSVKRMGLDYEVSTAIDGPTALEKIQQTKFDLMITDYMMGEMTGLDLIGEVRRIAPKMQIILMSAYDTTNLRDIARDMGLGYIGKPFTVDQVLEEIECALAQTGQIAPPQISQSTTTNSDLNEMMKTLYTKTGAHYVLLLNAQGRPIHAVGNTKQAMIARLATFVAANFLAVTELASLMGDNSSVFKSSYYEGSNYNIYAYNINGEYFLAVVFGTKDKPGTIWFYTKQTAERLASSLPRQSSAADGANAALVAEFNNLLGD